MAVWTEMSVGWNWAVRKLLLVAETEKQHKMSLYVYTPIKASRILHVVIHYLSLAIGDIPYHMSITSNCAYSDK